MPVPISTLHNVRDSVGMVTILPVANLHNR